MAVSRVRNEYSLFIRNFDVKQIHANEKYIAEMESLRTKKTYQFVNTYIDDQIFEDGSTEIKLGYLNINSLLNKVEDIDEDKNLLGLDILVLSETRLSKETQVNLKNWNIHRFDFEDKNSKAPHLGLALLSRETSKTKIGIESSVIKLSEKTFFQ